MLAITRARARSRDASRRTEHELELALASRAPDARIDACERPAASRPPAMASTCRALPAAAAAALLLLLAALPGPVESSIFGIGVYTDTPGSPPFEEQLDTARDLVGRGGWVTIFLCSWRTHTTSCVNRSTTHDPASSAMLQAAYDRGLNVVARIGNPYTVRDHADDPSRRSFRGLGAAYARLVASLPAPPPGSVPLFVQVRDGRAVSHFPIQNPSQSSVSCHPFSLYQTPSQSSS